MMMQKKKNERNRGDDDFLGQAAEVDVVLFIFSLRLATLWSGREEREDRRGVEVQNAAVEEFGTRFGVGKQEEDRGTLEITPGDT
ncbi:hypothetical protein R1sor_018666 [Riccia sorocarpa]|uniref:Uncharacterized protein n=1 Tax=Riccia sorocarpa TaxID=122646 RepID=A0ABD3IC19_9MARC